MNLLFDNELLVVNPKLATLIGLNEAIILQQMHYWIGKTNNNYDGKKWIYNSVSEWAKQFPFFSDSTIVRTIKNIEKKGLVFVGNYNKDGRDRTKWYSIDYTKLDELEQLASSQNESMHLPKMSKPLPETTTETTNNILLSGNFDKFSDDEKLKRFLHKNPDAHIYTALGKKWGSVKDLECAKWIYEKLLIVNPTAVEPNWVDWSNDIRLLRTQVLGDHVDNPHKEWIGYTNSYNFFKG
jgi:DNA-binding PadR family transcriptional regulator